MPYVCAKLSCSVSEQQKEQLKTAFGKSMEIIGKTESWLMVEIADNCDLYFQGNKNNHSAIISVSLLGKASKQAYNDMTSYICKNVESITSVPSDRIYVKYQKFDTWGWNGNNF